MLCPAPSLSAEAEFEKYAKVWSWGPGLRTHAVVTTSVGLPVTTPFAGRAKFTSPGEADTEIESFMMAARFTPAMFERTCARAGMAANIRRAHPSSRKTPRACFDLCGIALDGSSFEGQFKALCSDWVVAES